MQADVLISENCPEKDLEQRRQIHIRLNQAKKKHVKTKGLECIMPKFSHTFLLMYYLHLNLCAYSILSKHATIIFTLQLLRMR